MSLSGGPLLHRDKPCAMRARHELEQGIPDIGNPGFVRALHPQADTVPRDVLRVQRTEQRRERG